MSPELPPWIIRNALTEVAKALTGRTAYEKIWVLMKNGGIPPQPSPASSDELQRIEDYVVKSDESALRKLAREYVPENAFPGHEQSDDGVLHFDSKAAAVG